ncbi:MAG: pyridoxal phosphate-dependent aminotransferase [Spirochaetia bacterium]|nr:pyridoxal phosphate-dependent aminotransferase [Spirochaetales bacterium]MBR5927434.1 pyridoxal phosphate-dependent aminotransferase [Spirochaetia bacterium]
MEQVNQAVRMNNVHYAIRGPLLDAAQKLEKEGRKIYKLNIGNTGAFNFDIDPRIQEYVIQNFAKAGGYSDSSGIAEARLAIKAYHEKRGIKNITIDDIYIGNGVSELIAVVMQALLNPGDEVLLPAPDYPLWTASVNLCEGKAVHYICDEESDWNPDLKDMESKITSRTKAIVLINPNNPTGSVYSKEIIQGVVKIAQKYGLIIFSDEIYDRILYDGDIHYSPAAMADDILVFTFNGLSKVHRACGIRAGWMVISGNKERYRGYLDGIKTLTSMRLCSNVPAQYAIKPALEKDDSIFALTAEGGRLREQRDIIHQMLNDIPGVSCKKARGSLYVFPKFDVEKFNIKDDNRFVLDFLNAKNVLMVSGTGFNWPHPDHCRIVLLPPKDDLEEAMVRLKDFLATYRQA